MWISSRASFFTRIYLAVADVYDGANLLGSAPPMIHTPLAIFGNGGTIQNVHYDIDDLVSANSTLYTLDNEPATDSYRQTLADRAEKAEQLQTILFYQKSPNVIAGISGTVDNVQITEGKKTVSTDGSGEMVAFTLGTGGATKMTVDIDELDINAVSVGQQATITLEAFGTEEFPASVTRISHIGEASGSISAYSTDLALANDSRLMSGMNGSVMILSDSVHDVLVVPLNAVHEDANGSFVYVLDSGNAQNKIYITTGLSDGTYAEVTSGLAEGDHVAYTLTDSQTMLLPVQRIIQGGMR